jgi:transposase
VRVTTAFNRLLSLPGASVTEVTFQDGAVVVDVALRRRRLCCPECEFSTAARYDTRPVFSTWRHTDMGRWRVLVRAGLRRLRCPTHGVRVEQVPFARYRSGFSRDLEDLVAYLATKTDKTTITRLSRVDWDTVGRICERVVAEGLDPGRLDGLVNIGVDEVSWRKHHRYLTLVTDHTGKKIVWGAEGKDTATLDAFFDELGEDRSAALQAVSMDMCSWSPTPWTWSAGGHGTNCASSPTRRPLRSSRGPVGRCSNARRTSPTTRPRRCANSAAVEVTCGAPTA